ncbi:telomere-protecting terminal protein Tpg [Streptomyces sp. NEAU-W12]|uniref:telomere-protecting terminal protein Tpg n=1 Tax=Streptomyces sp. NEAU-W12 TaxID=2994668 RepID=UPI00224B0CDF|nr:helix-turn-helix domain-containing protein [Streptomyces sp. NEAU-W12]MCX2928509.1 helix-turn-helix domain-containing protein [Streptomyces sp. NEAU-W12]
MKFLRKREKGFTKSLAERLGVSRKTVQRYLSGASSRPNERLQEALVQETESEWQPQVRAQARQRAASSGGLVISCRAYFGLGPEGTSDAGRVRDLTVAVTPSHAAAIIAAQEEGATEGDLHDAVAEAIADAYFRQGGGGRAGLEVKFADVEWLNIRF